MKLRKGVIAKEREGDLILLGTGRAAKFWRLNGTAKTMILQLLEGSTVTEVADRIAADNSTDPSVVETDIEKLIAALMNAGLVKP
ncbi:PqqD family protein [Leucobacter sp. G161]|uniref:PqqD family protein n=1 Tax=Leucobacter sp. G161 TaxID=663704 RepID=UPI0009F83A3C|nr:PqqD family protein [Leucobacter sp. G161]